MTNLKIHSNWDQYLERVLIVFKTYFKEDLNKSANINFENLYQRTLFELGIENNKIVKDAMLQWFEKVYNHKFLNPILSAPSLREMIIHNPSSYQVNGESLLFDTLVTENDYQLYLETIAHKASQSWNYMNPFTSFFATINGASYRVTLTHFSLTPNMCSKAFIRKIANHNFSLSDFVNEESQLELFQSLIKEKKNIILAGETGSGKTTMLSSFLSYIKSSEHLVIIEDTHELISSNVNHSYLLADKQENKSLKAYCTYALRMSPDRMVLGEMRGPEVVPFVMAMNNGHKGLMSTIHASSGKDTLTRLALLFSLFSDTNSVSFSQILTLICQNIDYVIHLKNRKVNEVIKVLGSEDSNPFYETIIS